MEGRNRFSFCVNLLSLHTKTAFTSIVLFNFIVTSLQWDEKHWSTQHIEIRSRGKGKPVQALNKKRENGFVSLIHMVSALLGKIIAATSWAIFFLFFFFLKVAMASADDLLEGKTLRDFFLYIWDWEKGMSLFLLDYLLLLLLDTSLKPLTFLYLLVLVLKG